MKKTSMMALAVIAMGIFVASTAQANLILNGGFEDNSVAHGKWRWFQSSDVNGWGGSNIEIWDNHRSITAFEGTQHAELNAHAGNGNAFSIYQTFNTDVGSIYDLSFAYGARRNNNEAFRVEVIGSSELLNELVDDHTVGNWSSYINTFVASSAQTTLRFTSVTPTKATVGNFLDNIYVGASEAHSVPELSAASAPISAALLLALLSLGVERRRRSRK